MDSNKFRPILSFKTNLFMKRLAFVLLIVGFAVSGQLSAQCSGGSSAQSSGKASCCAKSSSSASASSNIEQRVAADGTVSFVRKEVNTETGVTSYTQVAYNEQTREYVTVMPDQISAADRAAQPGQDEAPAASCNQSKTAASGACCAKPGAESSTSATSTTTEKSAQSNAAQPATRTRRSNTVKLASNRG